MPETDNTEILVSEGEFASGDGVPLWRHSALPATPPRARLCLLPGYGDHGGRYAGFLRWLAQRGVAAHSLDFRGQGRAGGRRGAISRWEEYRDDVNAFLCLPEVTSDSEPLFLVGQSHGGLVLIHHLLHGGAANGAILTAPFLRNRAPVAADKLLLARVANFIVPYFPIATEVPGEWMTADLSQREEDARDPLSMHIATPRWFLTMQTAQDEAIRRAPEFRTPVLMITGADDQVADNDATEAFFVAVTSPDRTYFCASPCRHEPLRETNREDHYRRILDWMYERLG